MKRFLDTIRKPASSPVSKKILYSVLVLIAGIALGTMAKILDETPSNLLPPFLEMLDLRNFFSRMGFWLFSGVCIRVLVSRHPLHAGTAAMVFDVCCFV
jgi:hypothetical protein